MLMTDLDYKFYKQNISNNKISYAELLISFEEAVNLSKTSVIIFCQFTGLYDKKGVKIYVGDILNYFNDKDFYAEILFNAPSYSMRWYNPKIRKLRHSHKEVEAILTNTEIVGENVGNIFVNNDLHENLLYNYNK